MSHITHFEAEQQVKASRKAQAGGISPLFCTIL